MSTALPADVAPTCEDEPALFEWLRMMREQHPIWQDRYGIWHVFRHGDVEAITRDPGTFSSDTSRLVPAGAPVRRGMLTQLDPPEHRALRNLVSAAFTPRTVAAIEPRIRAVTSELLDATSDWFDLVDALALPLPVIVITDLLGLPTQDRNLFHRWADELLSLQVDDLTDPELGHKTAATIADITAYLTEHCRDRRGSPREDLISALVTAEVDGRRLDDEEAANFSLLLLFAGHITSTLLLGNAVRTFDEHPGVWDELRTDPSLIPGAVEEVLRYRSPVIQIARSTLHPAELGGMTIPADVLVMPWLLSANRDARAHPEPDRFDIRRGHGGGTQLAFGHGVHFCLGTPLARLEARVALEELTGRYRALPVDHETVRRTGGPQHYQWNVLGTRHLPVRPVAEVNPATPA